MNDCPPIETLLHEDVIPGSLTAHVAQCEACHAIVTLKVFRGLPDRPETRDGCDDAVDAIAALADGVLDELGHRRLAVHLAGCAPCRETAVRVSFFKDDLDDAPELMLPPAPAVAAVSPHEPGSPAAKSPPEQRRAPAARREDAPPRPRGFRWPHLAAAGVVGAIATAGALRLARVVALSVVALPAANPAAVATHLEAAPAGERAELDAERGRLEARRAELDAREARLCAERAELDARAARAPAAPSHEAPKRRAPPKRP
jgi:hypothetical protein